MERTYNLLDGDGLEDKRGINMVLVNGSLNKSLVTNVTGVYIMQNTMVVMALDLGRKHEKGRKLHKKGGKSLKCVFLSFKL